MVCTNRHKENPLAYAPFIASSRFDDPRLALEQVQAIYRSSIEHLRDALQRFVAGEDMHERVRACYPFVRIQTDTVARADSPLAYGLSPAPACLKPL
ncbi:AMP nucleosidase [Janthinobacterium lividum]|nr:AMP nucleosidase [Janthinobacterium lividum]